MRWQINGFVFCEQQQTLTIEQNTVRIEPMMSDLLRYFCQHPDQIISKEQLLDEVWQGRYVSDNTVSKLITKLRKALQDDARNPSFILTVPKRGYRLVAKAEPIQSQAPTSLPASSLKIPVTFNPVYVKTLLLTFVLLLITFVVWITLFHAPSSKSFVSAKALTSDKGSEYFPSFNADGIRLAYMNHDGEKFRLMVKNIDSGEQVEIEHGNKVGVGPGSWNDSGTKLVYLVATQQRCQYFIREFNGLAMSEPKLIYTCNAGSFGAIKFTHDDNLLVFAQSSEPGGPYSLYSLDLDSGKTQWLPQPELHLGGNSQFDLHPTDNKLLISSPDKQQWEGFYQLDLDTQELSLLFRLNAYICCGIWSHDGDHVVLMGDHPAHEIVQYNLDGTNKTVLFSGPQQLSRPERHSNGKDYTFTAFKHDINVDQYHLTTGQTAALLHDTFDQRLAVLSPSAEQVAYISLTSGNEELWLYNRETKKKKKISQFADGRHYIDLTWSPDEQKVAALTLNAIHLIDLASGKAKVLPMPEKELRGISFKNSEQIAFSMKIGANWQVVIFHLEDESMQRLEQKWQSVQFAPSSNDWLWVDQDNNWYLGEDANPVKMPKNNLSAFYGRQFNVKKSAEHIAFYNGQKAKLEIYKTQSNELAVSLDSQIGHFSINGDIVLIGQKSSNSNDSDIYQTFRVTAR
ncbi:winged helix-turn-helix domain-containing protein [Thalassotalea aquiviva]|uniref:winged helix-turn-helix domain-containing protein n=1 Tax=Thalassotalea aquiviva TaxID=3242415 RepID=UPI00352AFA20